MCLSSFALEAGDAIWIRTSFPSRLPRTCSDRAGGQAPNTLAARWPAGRSASLCQSFPTFPPASSEVPSQGTSCFLQLLQWSSERVGAARSGIAPKVEAVWKKNILISTYLKNIIRNRKKTEFVLFCFSPHCFPSSEASGFPLPRMQS